MRGTSSPNDFRRRTRTCSWRSCMTGPTRSVSRSCARSDAAHDGSTLVVIEGVLGEQESEPRPRTLDLVMLTVTGGRERTAAELSALFEQSGFRLEPGGGNGRPFRGVQGRP